MDEIAFLGLVEGGGDGIELACAVVDDVRHVHALLVESLPYVIGGLADGAAPWVGISQMHPAVELADRAAERDECVIRA